MSGSQTPSPPPSLRLRSARADRSASDRALVERARLDGTPEARRAAVEGLLPLARALARRYHRGEEPLEDLEQVAAVGLLKAIDGFDLSRGTTFGSYAVPTIVGELRRHFRDKGWTVRVPRELQELSLRMGRAQDGLTAKLGRPPSPAELAERLEVSVEQVLEAREVSSAMRPVSLDRPATEDAEVDAGTLIDHLGDVDDGYDHTDHRLAASELLGRLPARERAIVELRFRDELTQTQIGERLGCSQMHVSRLLRRALSELNAMADAS